MNNCEPLSNEFWDGFCGFISRIDSGNADKKNLTPHPHLKYGTPGYFAFIRGQVCAWDLLYGGQCL